MKTHPLKISRLFGCLAACVAALLLTSSLPAQTATPSGAVKLKRADRTFILKAAKGGNEEVAISQVASERSTNQDVRHFADMMVADHSKANDELATLAANKGVSLPAKDDTEGGKWEKHSANDFDHDYIEKMVKDHDDTVKLFEKEATNGSDPDVVEFARKTLPTLQHHQQAATDLKNGMK